MYYVIVSFCERFCSEYIYLDDKIIPRDFQNACRNSDFQFIDSKMGTLFLDDECGNICPDLLYDDLDRIPLISDRLKMVLDYNDIRSLYYQRIKLIRKRDGFCADYWLALPMRIKCLDIDKSNINILGQAENPEIIPERVGYFDIFKLADVENNEIYVTEKIKQAIDVIEPTGFAFEKY